MPIPGASPIRPGDLDGLLLHQRKKEIVDRTRYLVSDTLEEPPHIQVARKKLQAQGGDWRTAPEAEILNIINSIHPRELYDMIPVTHPLKPAPSPSSSSHALLARIRQSQAHYYDIFSPNSPTSLFLSDLQTPLAPDSLPARLRHAGITITKVVHFTHPPPSAASVAGGGNKLTRTPTAAKTDQLGRNRRLFALDVARFLAEAQGAREGAVPHATYVVPLAHTHDDDAYVVEGIMKLDRGSFVLDTTMNGGVARAICEAGVRPGVVMREFAFWRDGVDEDGEALRKVAKV
ncbi:hypothetical protein NEMBOFW57_009614 [Staphylotrichum longicolle]|uniref:Uncharacterized protein n=1 Tax=Staphylotrichum longicolle TaxID=669026 RepID=A0AAD4EPB8_9PEZI|nr:hypothetical protein NEMBOFW57_009614 [Staphylotrichum longicolle]